MGPSRVTFLQKPALLLSRLGPLPCPKSWPVLPEQLPCFGSRQLQSCPNLPFVQLDMDVLVERSCTKDWRSLLPPKLAELFGYDTTSPKPSSSVHTCATSVDPTHTDSQSQNHRFRQHRSLRSAWLTCLAATPDAGRLFKRFATCGQNMWVQYSPSREAYRTVANACNLRICPVCGQRKRIAMALNASTALATLNRNRLKLITLTLQSSNAPLDVQLHHLRQAFRRLRQRQLWKRAVTGGFAVIEVTFNATTHQWHPHLHVVCESDYIPQHHLSAAWFAVTHSSTVVDIRICKPSLRLAAYFAKYLGKPPPLDDLDLPTERLQEFKHALDNSRLLIRFGKIETPVEEDIQDLCSVNDWRQYQPYDQLVEAARRHEPIALYVLGQLDRDPGYAQTPFDTDPPLSHNSPLHQPEI